MRLERRTAYDSDNTPILRLLHHRALILSQRDTAKIPPSMLQLDKFSAWVTIDGEETSEYNVEISDDGTEATCWIASQVNKVCTSSMWLIEAF